MNFKKLILFTSNMYMNNLNNIVNLVNKFAIL